jgi:hypothetical protein
MATLCEDIPRTDRPFRREQDCDISNGDIHQAYLQWNALKQTIAAGQLTNPLYRYREPRMFLFPWPPVLYACTLIGLTIGCWLELNK